MAKAKRGLLFSVLTLLIAIAVTATSTYAWFAVNRSVEATNMQVTLKSDTTYLVIGANATAPATVADIGTDGTQTSAEATASNAEVLPVRYNESATPTSGNSKWEIAAGTSYSVGTAKNSAYTPVATDNVGNYAIKYTFYVGLTATTAAAQANLKVSALSASAAANNGGGSIFLPAVSALVVCNGTEVDFEDINTPNAKINSANAIILSSLAVNTVYTVDVYVYINGDNAAVTSANATSANLGAYTVSMTLSID